MNSEQIEMDQHDRDNFYRGFMAAAGIVSRAYAVEAWYTFAKRLGQAEQAQIEACGEVAGRAQGRAQGRKFAKLRRRQIMISDPARPGERKI